MSVTEEHLTTAEALLGDSRFHYIPSELWELLRDLIAEALANVEAAAETRVRVEGELYNEDGGYTLLA